MPSPVINLNDIDLTPRPSAMCPTGPTADRYDSKIGLVSTRIGAQKLGYNITTVPPGKRAFPLHNHWVNEEMVFVLQGTGEAVIGTTHHPIQHGDFVAFPSGNSATAHQIINTGVEELRYLAVSTKMTPEICEYPVSGKFGVLGDTPSTDQSPSTRFAYIGRKENSGDYWETLRSRLRFISA